MPIIESCICTEAIILKQVSGFAPAAKLCCCQHLNGKYEAFVMYLIQPLQHKGLVLAISNHGNNQAQLQVRPCYWHQRSCTFAFQPVDVRKG